MNVNSRTEIISIGKVRAVMMTVGFAGPMEVFYRNELGGITRGIAHEDLRCIPPVWKVGDLLLSDLEQVSEHEWWALKREEERQRAIDNARPYTTAE